MEDLSIATNAPKPRPRWRQLVASAALLLAGTASAENLTVVMVGPMSGPEAVVGRSYAAGLQLAFDGHNRSSGANGHTLQLLRGNDGGRGADTVSETRRLLAEGRPVALAGYVGDEPVSALLRSGLLEQERLPLVGSKTIQLEVENPWVFGVRASTSIELTKLVQHMKTVGLQRVALFHEEGAQAVVARTEALCKEAGLQLVARASYPAGSSRGLPAAEQLLGSPAQAILIVSSSAAASAFIEGYRSSGGKAQLFAHSGADIEQLSKRLADEHMQNLAIAQVVPNPYKGTLKLSREFAAAAASANPPLEVPVGFTMMEGYIAGRLIAEGVRRISGPPSREALRNALERLGTLDLSGLRLTLGPGPINHTASQWVELSIVNREGKIRQ